MRGILAVETMGPWEEGLRISAIPAPDGGVGALLVVTNRTERALWCYNARGEPGGAWGLDFAEGALPPGKTVAWELAPGQYHLRAVGRDGDYVSRFGVGINPGELVRWVIREG